MLCDFLRSHRAELVERCRAKVASRMAPRATQDEMEHGIPVFLDQLIETLRLEQQHPPERLRLAQRDVPAEFSTHAAKHGQELLHRGFTLDQVVHDYGDLCQAVTELAIERDAPVSAREFHTLNRCLDQAIADAVTEYAHRRDLLVAEASDRAPAERLGNLAHEMRNSLSSAMLSFSLIKGGGVPIDGATSAIVDRSFIRMRDLIDRALADVRLTAGLPSPLDRLALEPFMADIELTASLEARAKGCEFSVARVDGALGVCADRQMLYSAVSNLLQNAFKFTPPRGHVELRTRRAGARILIEIEDQCGGLHGGDENAPFAPFAQQSADRSGLGLGLSIARRATEACGGTLRARDLPGVGCVFTVDLPEALDAKQCA